MSNKLHINKVRILELPSKQFQGEAYYEGVLIAITIKHHNKTNCIKALNRKIEEYNAMNERKVPLMKPDGEEIIYGQTQSKPIPVSTKPSAVIPDKPKPPTDNKALSDKPLKTENQDKGETKTQKSAKPKRKPFTPYGLNGYLVDKQGNVRLMLDRRASAQTIVLNPEMFAALADMVQRTQEQQNAIPE